MKRLVFAGVVGGLLGALIFWWYQTTFQNASVPDFIGNQIVSQGKYALSKTMVGWSVHIGVSLSYGFLLAIAARILFPGSFLLNRAASLAVALFLGLITTLIAPPAIQITIAILSGKGFPSPLWDFNPASGHTLWNHMIFFVVVWLVDTLYIQMFERGKKAELNF